MSKFSGLVGYVGQEESVPGVWTSVEKSIMMKGDIISQRSTNQESAKVNTDVTLNHRVSLIGDAYAFDNYYNIKWIEIDGMKWEVYSIEVRRPRLTLSLGGMWNAQ